MDRRRERNKFPLYCRELDFVETQILFAKKWNDECVNLLSGRGNQLKIQSQTVPNQVENHGSPAWNLEQTKIWIELN